MRKSGLSALLLIAVAACQDASRSVQPDVRAALRASAVRTVSGGIPGQYIVVFNDEINDATGLARQLAAQHGASVQFTYQVAIKGFAARMSDAAADALSRNPNVAYVEQDQPVAAVGDETMDAAGDPWGLDRIDAASGLNGHYLYTLTGAGVTAYIIDTGIRTTHSEFGGRASGGYTAIADGNGTNDCHGHGTHVSGTVGGATYGVAKGVTLVAVRVLDCGGNGTTAQVIAGIDWVTANHAARSVANMSLGSGASSSMDQAVVNSINSGVSYAIAAGNGNIFGFAQDACNYSPARVGPAMTIGATSKNDAKTSWSNYGNCVDWFAPGENIKSAWKDSDVATNTISGTSMATPHTTGVAALYLEANPTATPQQVRDGLYAATTKGVVTSSSTVSNHLLYTPPTGFGPPPPPPSPPAAPTGLAATTFDQQRVDLGWTDNSSDETGFELQRSTDGFATFVVINLGANVTSYSNTGLAASTTYSYRVRANNVGGPSGFSNTANATTSAAPVDAPPVARYSWSCGGKNGRNCSFDGTTSTDDHGISSYAWAYADGAAGSGSTTSHRFATGGSYNVTLTVKDAANQSGVRTCAVATGMAGTCAP